MEIEEHIQKAKAFSTAFLDFLEDTEDSDSKYEALIDIIQNKYNIYNKNEILQLFNHILIVVNNHHRTFNFFTKVGQVLKYLIKDKSLPITEIEILQFFEKSKQIILFLFENEIIIPTEKVQNYIYKKQDSQKFKYRHFLYAGIKPFISKDKQSLFKSKIEQKYNVDIDTFNEKCRIGENDSYIATLIRKDSVEEFIEAFHKNDLDPSNTINSSIFESNDFLIGKNPTLLEYAAFFGSIQIFEYLLRNNANLTNSLWLYAIHSNNAEMIYLLEENHILPEDKIYKDFFIESIKCHHNEIALYLKINLMKNQIRNFMKYLYEYQNFYLLPDEISKFIIESENNENEFKMSDLCLPFTKITLPSTITSISKGAFDSCSTLVEIKGIPSSTKVIKSSTFKGCSKLELIEIPSSVTSICSYAFYGCSSLKQIEIPASVTEIGPYSFYKCSSLKKINIPSGVIIINESTFFECSSLEQIDIPSSVTSICSYAFYGCSSLKQATIPPSTTKIGFNAFYGCNLLK